ncbi:ribbon-helix-helix domain-containing protein [Novispirillum itersonii]|uniref:ribbon-helix-helix domain-containing protein n=1 Tax=Novispirillum itersonii TaxID=189 RepID=UPI000365E570|nr:ribbon-helix-helix domain-containing protein [Novispirillum itersonii]
MTSHSEPGSGSNAVIKRSVRIARHSTSISLEDSFWDALRDIAAVRGLSLNALIAEIDSARAGDDPGNLSSAARVYALQWFRQNGQHGQNGQVGLAAGRA